MKVLIPLPTQISVNGSASSVVAAVPWPCTKPCQSARPRLLHPEALNDSQFLVPRMTRDQLREAIEGPIAVGGGKIAPRLVQRLLYDVDALAGRTIRVRTESSKLDDYDHDQLPVLQHALMRVWEVSKDVRASGGLGSASW